MKKTVFRKVLALIMVLSLIPCWGVSAWAADPPELANGITKEIDHSISVENYPFAVAATNGGTATVGGDVSNSNNSSQAVGVYSSSSGSNETSTVTVTGDVSASSSSDSYGVLANSSGSESTAVVNVGGDVSSSTTSSSSAEYAAGVWVQAHSGSENSAAATVGGNVSAETSGNADAYGVAILSNKADDVDVQTGDVSAQATQSSSGDAEGINVVQTGGTTTVNAGNVEAEAEGTGSALGIYMEVEKGAVDLTAGKVEVEAEQGNLPSMDTDATGILLEAKDSSADITVAELEVTAGAGVAHGIDVAAPSNGNVTMTMNGPMTVTGVEYAQAVSMDVGKGSTVNLTVNDDVTVEAEGSVYGSGNGMYINMDGGEAYVVVNGDVSSSGSGILTAGKSGLVDVTIDGNLTAETTGLAVQTELDTKFLITESIKADGIGIEIGNGVTKDNLEVTVWQIDTNKVNGEDHVAVEGADKKITEASKKVEQSINYIIKITPSQQSMISLTGTTEKDGFQTAHMGDKVAMKVNVPAGYQLTGAFGDKGEQLPLKMDSDGNYYIIVPMGGGVYLSAVLSQIMSEGGSVSVEDLGSYYSYAGNLSYVTITFELNEGHMLSGNPGPIIKSVPAGTWVRLIEVPYKTGSTFELWHTDDPSIKVSQPNESFCAMGDVTFTAKWVGEELPYKMTADESNLVSTLSAASMIPVIEEPVEEAPTVEEAESTTENTESITDEAPAAEEVPVSEEPASAKDETAADALPDEAATEEAPVAAEPASESSMMVEAMTTLTAATEALQAATEALIANTAPAADEAEAATEEPASEEADTASVEDAADAEISAEAAEEEQPAVEESSSSMDAAREELQRITEELDAAKSELKATTEELDTAKGELKATTEELNAAKDELRATTTELVEAKDALRSAADELNAAREEFRLLLEELKAQVPAVEAEEGAESSPAADAAEEEAPVEEDVPAEEPNTVDVDAAAESELSAAEGTDKS